jgi:hypothetical protein
MGFYWFGLYAMKEDFLALLLRLLLLAGAAVRTDAMRRQRQGRWDLRTLPAGGCAARKHRNVPEHCVESVNSHFGHSYV